MKVSSKAVSGIFSLVVLVGCSAPTAPTGASPAVIGAGTAAQGGVSLPFKGSFDGTQTVTPGTPPFASVEMQAEGAGTQLGRFEIALPHTVNFATASASGTCTIVASDGSRIVASFTGQAQLGPVVTIVEQATITGGTGRFADASGTFTINRTFDPATGATTGSFEGTLELPRPGPR
jgi:hypothetical protein